MTQDQRRALALMPHPDDCEILCAGTLLRLRAAGYELHVATMTPGDKGSATLSREEIAAIRREEAQQGALALGATSYTCLECADLEITFDNATRRKVAGLLRRIQPSLVFTTPPVDYMADHEITSRLVRDACFNAAVRNYETEPGDTPTSSLPYLYYSDAIGGHDLFGEPARVHFLVDITDEIERKAEALACHASQREWLRKQHGLDEYLDSMKAWCAVRGKQIGVAYAEGFCQHLGHPHPTDNPLASLLHNPTRPLPFVSGGSLSLPLRSPQSLNSAADVGIGKETASTESGRTEASLSLRKRGSGGGELLNTCRKRAPMPRPLSKIAPDWWDYTTLEPDLLQEAARLTLEDVIQLARPGFAVQVYDTLEEFYLAEALEYVNAWKQATPDNPVGICGPIGPTEQLPLVARLVNDLGLSLKNAHFWGMDEWFLDGKEVAEDHPLSFARADRELCFDRIRPELAVPAANLHFPAADTSIYEASWSGVRCAVMQGGQGEVKHWAFNDPVRRQGAFQDAPPTPAEYRQLGTRVVELHPLTLIQNARTSGGGNIPLVPTHALTVGPKQTWLAEKVSIWHPGHHDNPFGIRLTSLMIARGIADSSVPMSLLAEHPNVQFSFYRGGFGTCETEMH